MRTSSLILGIALGATSIGCGGNKEDGGGDKGQPSVNGPFPEGEHPKDGGGPGMGGPGALALQADFSGAIGLLAMEGENGSGLRLTEGEGGTGLLKIDDEGNVEDAVKAAEQSKDENCEGCNSHQQAIPAVKSMAKSPTGKIYIHFEHPIWLYNDGSSEGQECNLFRVGDGTVDEMIAKSSPLQDLICIAPGTYVQNWDMKRDSVFQFDDAGNIYFPGYNQKANGQELVRVSEDGKDKKVIINSKIYFSDFFVTPKGGVFYTGQSNTKDSVSAGGFFRFVTPEGQLQQIAKNFWDFKFEPVMGEESEKAVFYGPNPNVEVDANDAWSTACIYEYDPSKFDSDLDNPLINAVDPVVTCGNDIYSWINLQRPQDEDEFGKGPFSYSNAVQNPSSEWVEEYVDRCTSSGQVFAGGGEIRKLHQNDVGDIFVIGRINQKRAGSVTCQVDVYGQYCAGENNNVLEASDAVACAALDGTWTETNGYCNTIGNTRAECIGNSGIWTYGSEYKYPVEGSVCGKVSASTGATIIDDTETLVQRVDVSNRSCNADSEDNPWEMFKEFNGLAKVDRENKTLVPIPTGKGEIPLRFWFIGDAAYYLTEKNSVYKLMKFLEGGQTAELLRGYEVYHLAASGRPNTLIFNGLNFNNNSYVFGDLDLSENELHANDAVQGKVSSMVMFEE